MVLLRVVLLRVLMLLPLADATSNCTFNADTTGNGNLVVPVVNGVASKEACTRSCHPQTPRCR